MFDGCVSHCCSACLQSNIYDFESLHRIGVGMDSELNRTAQAMLSSAVPFWVVKRGSLREMSWFLFFTRYM